jgi:hypothetical protein
MTTASPPEMNWVNFPFTFESSDKIVASWEGAFDSAIPILEYKIFFYIPKYQRVLHLPDFCNGNDQAVIKNMSCSLNMTVFLDAPFYLELFDEVLIQVQARNKLGWSPLSPVNSV